MSKTSVKDKASISSIRESIWVERAVNNHNRANLKNQGRTLHTLEGQSGQS